MRRWVAAAILTPLLVGCSSRSSEGSLKSREDLFITIEALDHIQKVLTTAHRDSVRVFHEKPYSPAGRAAIAAAQRAWRIAAKEGEFPVFSKQALARNRYLAPAQDSVSAASSAWLRLLRLLAFTSRTHVVPKAGLFERLERQAERQEAASLRSLGRAQSEDARHYCESTQSDPLCATPSS